MSFIYIDIALHEFEAIFSEIKTDHLSKANFPKIIVGSGLSLTCGIPGMKELSEKLDKEFSDCNDNELKEIWSKYRTKIMDEGLEDGLLQVSSNEEHFIQKVKEITSDFILEEEYKKHDDLIENTHGFEKLLKYLSDTVSINNPIIDVMTPNYDRIIEIFCDKLNLHHTLGFTGDLYRKFSNEVLKFPYNYYNKSTKIVRIFKPHGSINWITNGDNEYQTNDYSILKSNSKFIDIVAPGSGKYKEGMLNNRFRCHRETFNELISDSNKDYSIFIYGYGFNDQHFNTVFERTEKKILVLSYSINRTILEKAIENKNWTIFYKSLINDSDVANTTDDSFMVYKGITYRINANLWDINEFTEIFIGKGK